MAQSKLITNQANLLSEISKVILPHTVNLDILVGYFYFSGFQEIYKEVIEKDVRILVGMDMGIDVNNNAVEILKNGIDCSIKVRQQKYYENLTKIINCSEEFDKPKSGEAWKLFTDKIKDGSLEIKRTNENNHSKMYLFYHKPEQVAISGSDGIVIVGSSNLSRSGMSGRREANAILRDEADFDEACSFFESEWETATELVNKENFNQFEKEVIDKVWINNTPSPFVMYLRVLDEYFGLPDETVKSANQINKNYSNLEYQTDAVKQALKVIDNHNGCIIADVVGLGKSIIASVVAHNLNIKTIIIAPPHLSEQWNDYKYEFGFEAEVCSSGSIKKLLEKNFDNSQKKLIIIDEAHKFRNDTTDDYSRLHQICQNNKVLLLTATPFNNSPADLYSLIKLFQVPGRSTIKTVDNLAGNFKRLIIDYKKLTSKKESKLDSPNYNETKVKISNQLRLMIEPIIIRRSRLDLQNIAVYKKDLSDNNIRFSELVDPELIEYELADIYPIYIKTLQLLCPISEQDGFIGAKYTPIRYLKDFEKYRKDYEDKFGAEFGQVKQSQDNLAAMMKNLLVKRFESSMQAFRATLNNMIGYHQNTLDWHNNLGLVAIYKKGKLPLADEIFDSTNDAAEAGDEGSDKIQAIESNLQIWKDRGLETISKNYLKVDFAKDVETDLKTLKEIYSLWFDSPKPLADPKLESLIAQLKKHQTKNISRKIVIFSEYADTVDYLEDSLKSEFRVIKYTSKLAKKELKKIIRSNFDAGVEIAKQKNDYDIIIATDAISEGYNLHRAGLIINYDIPFNPTRVIQRVGRINRINKKVFEQLFILNFFPSFVGKAEFRVEKLATLKMNMIHTLLGEDAKVLSTAEVGDLKSFINQKLLNKQKEVDTLSWDTKYQNLLREYKRAKSPEYQVAKQLPTKSRIARHKELSEDLNNDKTVIFDTSQGLLIFVKQRNNFIFKIQLQDGIVHNLTPQQGIEIFEAELNEQGYPITSEFDTQYDNLKSNLNKYSKTNTKLDKGENETLTQLRGLESLLPQNTYLKEIIKVIKEYKGLPDGVIKSIRSVINFKQPEQSLEEIQKIVPNSYIENIFKAANHFDDPETILFAQEITKE